MAERERICTAVEGIRLRRDDDWTDQYDQGYLDTKADVLAAIDTTKYTGEKKMKDNNREAALKKAQTEYNKRLVKSLETDDFEAATADLNQLFVEIYDAGAASNAERLKEVGVVGDLIQVASSLLTLNIPRTSAMRREVLRSSAAKIRRCVDEIIAETAGTDGKEMT